MSVAHIQYFRSCDANIEHEVVVLCGIKKLCWNDNGASLKYLKHGDAENILQHVLHCGQSRHISVKILLILLWNEGMMGSDFITENSNTIGPFCKNKTHNPHIIFWSDSDPSNITWSIQLRISTFVGHCQIINAIYLIWII